MKRIATYVAVLGLCAGVTAVQASTAVGASAATEPAAISPALVPVTPPPGGVATGLVLWLDASNPTGDGTTPTAGAEITRWEDLSGTGNEASVNPNGVGGTNTGAFYEVAPTGFNGNPALRFDRQTDARGSVYQTADLDIRAITRPDITVLAVYRPTKKNSSDINGIWGADNLNWDRFFLSHINAFGGNGLVALGPSSNGGETVPGAAETNVSHLMVVAYSGKIENNVNVGDPGASYVDYNCVRQKSFTDTTDLADAQTTLSVGWDGDSSAFDGYIAELVVYERALTDLELASVNTYLATKYDLGSGCAAFAATPATVTAPSGSMVYGATPPVLDPATAVETGTTVALTFDTDPTCAVYEQTSPGPVALVPSPIVLSATTPTGTYDVRCSGGTIDGAEIDTYVDGTFTVNQASSTVTYTGPTILSSSSAQLSATVVSPCAEGSTVEFTVTPNPTPPGPYTATVSGGVATTSSITLTPATTYSVVASSASDANCAADTDSATLVTTAPGVSTTGVGTYLAGSTTVKYSHQVSSTVKTNTKARTRTTTYRGNVTWEIPGQTRLVGTVASTLLQSLDGTLTSGSAAWVTFPCGEPVTLPTSGGSSSPKPSAPVCGSFSGIGTLQSWNPSLNKGRGGWSSVGAVSVAFEVTVHDAGSICASAPTSSTSKKRPVCTLVELPGDAFGIRIGGSGVTDALESDPVAISTGYIRSVA